MDITNIWYNYLHTERKLSHNAIKTAGLDVLNGMLKIPVHDIGGKIIFSKYRKAPWIESGGPKYQYEVGSSVSLYGIDHIGDDMIITEGELDALALISCGYNACSSTGGAMSFQSDWVHLFNKSKVTIMFDNDNTGIRGAVRAALMFNKFTYRWVQPRFGKDIGDALKDHGVEAVKSILESSENCLHMDIPDLTTKRAKRDYLRILKAVSRTMTHGSIGNEFIRALMIEIKIHLSESTKKPYHSDQATPELQRAKKYPIENIIKVVGRQAICPFHSEKTPSLHVYPDNHAYCFGSCRKAFDSLDIAQEVWKINFKEALKRLST